MTSIKKENINCKLILYSLLRTVAVLLAATLFALLLVYASDIKNNIAGVYMLAVVVISTITTGYFWGILASVISIIGVNYFFTFPYFAINFLLDGYPITFLIMLLLSCISSALMGKIKKQAQIALAREKRFETLYTINKDLVSTFGMERIIDSMLEHFNRFSHCSTIYYNEDPCISTIVQSKLIDPSHMAIFCETQERSLAHLAYESQSVRGMGPEGNSDEDSQAEAVYIPIVSPETNYGLIGILILDDNMRDAEFFKFLNVLALQFILAMDRQTLFDKQQNILVETEKEKMRSNLLRAVSHDLRTPLTCIQGSSATLLENKNSITEEVHDKLLKDIYQDCQWLVHMVENLLSVTRISDKTTTVKKQLEAVEEVVAESVMRIKKRFPTCQCSVSVPDDFLLAPMDATLIEQVIINLVENSISHAKTTSPIDIRVLESPNGDFVQFQVSDQGVGIPRHLLPQIFDGSSDRNYNDSSRGIGIGLSICKSIILAHGGSIEAKNNDSSGVTFQFSLPLKGADQ